MNIVRKYSQNIDDNEVIGPRDLFGVFNKAQKVCTMIEATEHNLINQNYLDSPSCGSQLLSPKSTSQFKLNTKSTVKVKNNMANNKELAEQKKTSRLHQIENNQENTQD